MQIIQTISFASNHLSKRQPINCVIDVEILYSLAAFMDPLQISVIENDNVSYIHTRVLKPKRCTYPFTKKSRLAIKKRRKFNLKQSKQKVMLERGIPFYVFIFNFIGATRGGLAREDKRLKRILRNMSL